MDGLKPKLCVCVFVCFSWKYWHSKLKPQYALIYFLYCSECLFGFFSPEHEMLLMFLALLVYSIIYLQ